MREPTFCICKNKDADQLCGNREADQHPCFLNTDSTIPLLSKFINFQSLAVFFGCMCMLVCVGPSFLASCLKFMLFSYCFSRGSICINHELFRKFINGH